MKTKNMFLRMIITSTDDRLTILVRLIVGLVFLTEGIQKFLFPALLGTGRFMQIGFSNPAFWAYFTGSFEIVCGTFILAGFLTRMAAFPLFIIMMTAFVTTKWPILIHKGIWIMVHEYRTDFAMTLLLIYLSISGGGKWSVDSKITKHLHKE
jgi:Predicted membrane protein